MIVVTLLYLYGVRQQFLYVNTDLSRTDQAAYLNAAERLKTSNYTALTDRNRMPVYPFLLSLLYEPGLSDEAFFARGKLLNSGLSLLILPILFWIFRQYLPLFTAVNLFLIHAFTLYIFKAAYVQTELLFYLLNFAGFLLLCRLLWRPAWQDSWQTAVFTGILLGVAHLTKASIMPGLALFVGAAILQVIFRQVRKRPSPPHIRQFFLDLAVPALVVLFFLLTIWPYIQNSKERFGHYFYNVNSTFYIWYDNWDEVEAGTKAHGDRISWPDMPPEELPTAAKYFREHSLAQFGQRLFEGFLATLVTMFYSYGYLKYLTLLLGFVIALVIINYREAQAIVARYPFLSLFVITYFSSYLLLYAWYWPISSGNRFVLALFSPIMFTLAFLLFRLFEHRLSLPTARHSQKMINLGQVLNWVLFALLLVDGYGILIVRIATLYGGF